MNAGGRVVVDLSTGTVDSAVQLLPPDGTFDLWLIDNKPGHGHTTLAQHGDDLMKIGTYALVSGSHRLSVSLGAAAFDGFFPDRAFLVRSDASPVDGFVLTGPSTLFSRLQHRQVRFVDHATARRGFDPAAASTRAASFEKVITQGRQLFVNETFDGNGRTCATCHVEANNFTVDPKLIATLPPNDPLFVAETNPALATLENSDLLRRFGMFLVNADGFDPSRGFVFRSAQNVQALANSIDAAGSESRVSTSAPTDEIPIRPSASAGATMALRSATSRSWPSRSMPRRRSPASRAPTSACRRMRNWMRWRRINSPSADRKTSTSRRCS